MEYLEGESLADRLKKGALPLEQVLRYGFEIADALDRAHRKGIVHRDLKPANVMLTKTGTKLLDFGLAKLRPAAATEESQPTLTESGELLGTPRYMAPEQLEGKEPDARTDIFAFGAVLYEMATGQKAFPAKSQTGVITAILSSDPAPISALQPATPPALDRAVATCLAKDPDDRWQNAHDLAAELKWIAEVGVRAGVPAKVGGRAPESGAGRVDGRGFARHRAGVDGGPSARADGEVSSGPLRSPRPRERAVRRPDHGRVAGWGADRVRGVQRGKDPLVRPRARLAHHDTDTGHGRRVRAFLGSGRAADRVHDDRRQTQEDRPFRRARAGPVRERDLRLSGWQLELAGHDRFFAERGAVPVGRPRGTYPGNSGSERREKPVASGHSSCRTAGIICICHRISARRIRGSTSPPSIRRTESGSSPPSTARSMRLPATCCSCVGMRSWLESST